MINACTVRISMSKAYHTQIDSLRPLFHRNKAMFQPLSHSNPGLLKYSRVCEVMKVNGHHYSWTMWRWFKPNSSESGRWRCWVLTKLLLCPNSYYELLFCLLFLLECLLAGIVKSTKQIIQTDLSFNFCNLWNVGKYFRHVFLTSKIRFATSSLFFFGCSSHSFEYRFIFIYI